MHTNVIIKGIGKYIPKKKVSNEYFINHFDKMGKECRGLLKHHERKYHYISDYKVENSLYMGIEAAKDVIEKTNTDINDIDMIVFVSDTPEYSSPTNALKVNHYLNLKNANRVFDMNCNCGGVIVALNLISNQMKMEKDIKKTLVIGAVAWQNAIKWDDVVPYITFSDFATAMILEKREEEQERGIIGYKQMTNSSYHFYIESPKIGLAKSMMTKVSMDAKRLDWEPFKTEFFADIWNEITQDLLKEKGLSVNDLYKLCITQFSPPDNKKLLELANISEDKYVFNGDRYGYTGVNSPILCLDDIWEECKDGDYLLLMSVSAGVSMMGMLYKK